MKKFIIRYSFSPMKTEKPVYEKPLIVEADNLRDAFKVAKEIICHSKDIVRMEGKQK